MKASRWCVVFLIAWSMQSGVSYAAADWLDKLSGPGPFWGWSVQYQFVCLSQAGDKTVATWLHPFEPGAGLFTFKKATVDVNKTGDDLAHENCRAGKNVRALSKVVVRQLFSRENNLFPADPTNDLYKVTLWQLNWSYTIRVHDALDLGVGAGWTHFSGDAFDGFSRLSLTPLSVEFSPLAVRGDELKNRWLKVTTELITFAPGFDRGTSALRLGVDLMRREASASGQSSCGCLAFISISRR